MEKLMFEIERRMAIRTALETNPGKAYAVAVAAILAASASTTLTAREAFERVQAVVEEANEYLEERGLI